MQGARSSNADLYLFALLGGDIQRGGQACHQAIPGADGRVVPCAIRRELVGLPTTSPLLFDGPWPFKGIQTNKSLVETQQQRRLPLLASDPAASPRHRIQIPQTNLSTNTNLHGCNRIAQSIGQLLVLRRQ